MLPAITNRVGICYRANRPVEYCIRQCIVYGRCLNCFRDRLGSVLKRSPAGFSKCAGVAAVGQRSIDRELAAGRAFQSNFIQLNDEIEVASRLSKMGTEVVGAPAAEQGFGAFEG